MTIHAPIDSRPGLPGWALGLTVFLFLVGGWYAASNVAGENPPFALPGVTASAAPSGAPNPQVGEQLVGQATPACSSCHGPDLGGQGQFPSLHGISEGAKSENLQDLAAQYPDDWIALWIDGTGPEVQGLDRGGMPAFGDQFAPDQIASIVAYLREL
jgi:mono/diheme cytochrome c family protein